MLSLDQQANRYYSVSSQCIAPEGPRAVPLNIDFSKSNVYTLNLQNVQARNFISMIQALWIDNSNSASPVTVSFPNTGQSIILASGRQGYFMVLAPNPVSMIFQSAGGVVLNIDLLNFPVTNNDWPAYTGA
jgi:hypothetical protein